MVKKKNIMLILAITGIMLSAGSVSTAINTNTPDPNVYTGTIYVSTTGNDANNGFTPDTSKKSIKKAVKSAPDGATVFVAPGTYKESSILIDKYNLKLIGSGQDNTIIISDGKTIKSNAYDAYIKGFTMRMETVSILSPVIAVTGGSLIVEDCTLLNFCGDDNLSYINWFSSGEVIMKKCTFVDHKSMFDYERSLK